MPSRLKASQEFDLLQNLDLGRMCAPHARYITAGLAEAANSSKQRRKSSRDLVLDSSDSQKKLAAKFKRRFSAKDNSVGGGATQATKDQGLSKQVSSTSNLSRASEDEKPVRILSKIWRERFLSDATNLAAPERPSVDLSPLELLLILYHPIIECFMEFADTQVILTLMGASMPIRQCLYSTPHLFRHLDFGTQNFHARRFPHLVLLPCSPYVEKFRRNHVHRYPRMIMYTLPISHLRVLNLDGCDFGELMFRLLLVELIGTLEELSLVQTTPINQCDFQFIARCLCKVLHLKNNEECTLCHTADEEVESENGLPEAKMEGKKPFNSLPTNSRVPTVKRSATVALKKVFIWNEAAIDHTQPIFLINKYEFLTADGHMGPIIPIRSKSKIVGCNLSVLEKTAIAHGIFHNTAPRIFTELPVLQMYTHPFISVLEDVFDVETDLGPCATLDINPHLLDKHLFDRRNNVRQGVPSPHGMADAFAHAIASCKGFANGRDMSLSTWSRLHYHAMGSSYIDYRSVQTFGIWGKKGRYRCHPCAQSQHSREGDLSIYDYNTTPHGCTTDTYCWACYEARTCMACIKFHCRTCDPNFLSIKEYRLGGTLVSIGFVKRMRGGRLIQLCEECSRLDITSLETIFRE